MRNIAKQAIKVSKRVRRQEERRKQNNKEVITKKNDLISDEHQSNKEIHPPKPFDDIEV
jgi:hypothetical protein